MGWQNNKHTLSLHKLTFIYLHSLFISPLCAYSRMRWTVVSSSKWTVCTNETPGWGIPCHPLWKIRTVCTN